MATVTKQKNNFYYTRVVEWSSKVAGHFDVRMGY